MADRNMVNMTITVTKEQRKQLRYLAAEKDTSISAIIRDWIDKYCKPKKT